MYGVYRVEGRRPVGRPRKTWLESGEADMAELEIDKSRMKKDEGSTSVQTAAGRLMMSSISSFSRLTRLH